MHLRNLALLISYGYLALPSHACPIEGGCVYPVGLSSEVPTNRLPNGNGYAISAGYFTPSNPKHAGVDLDNGFAGGEVRSIAEGRVVERRESNTGFGWALRIEHALTTGGKVFSIYGHMVAHSLRVSVGDPVHKGQVVGSVNSTGVSTNNHLHFSIRLPDNFACGYVPSAIELTECISDSQSKYRDPLEFIGAPPTVPTPIGNQPPTARFTMTSGGQSATEGQSLNVAVPIGTQATVALSMVRSTDSDGNIAGGEITIDNQPFFSFFGTPTVNASLGVGTHTISVVVKDNLGAQSAAATGTVVVTTVNQPPAPGPMFSIRDLGTLPGDVAAIEITGLNDHGVVVGRVALDASTSRTLDAFIWSASLGMQPLFPGFDEAVSINNSGQVVGFLFGPTSFYEYLYSNGTLHDLTLTFPQVAGAWPVAINNSGQILLYRRGYTGQVHVITGSVVTTDTICNSNSACDAFQASDMNDVGSIVGSNDRSTPFLYSNSQLTYLPPCGGPGRTTPLAVNNLGQVVGSGRAAWLWSAQTGCRDLMPSQNVFDARANDINDSGAVVGVGFSAEEGFVPFIWTATKGLQNLNKLIPSMSGWHINNVFKINSSGQIAGTAIRLGLGPQRFVLLTPQ